MAGRLLGSLAAVLLLVVVQVAFPRFDRAARGHRTWWISLASGIAIGYVFLYLLPKIGDYTAAIVRNEQAGWEFFQYRLYGYCLVGLLLYYCLDRVRVLSERWRTRAVVLHGLGFSLYCALIGYFLPNVPRAGFFPYGLVALVFAIHFLGVNHHLRHWHPQSYDRYLRWFMAISLIAGWIIGVTADVPKTVVSAWTAILAGAMMINVLNEELPSHREGKLIAFVAGIVCFTLVAMIVRSLPQAPG